MLVVLASASFRWIELSIASKKIFKFLIQRTYLKFEVWSFVPNRIINGDITYNSSIYKGHYQIRLAHGIYAFSVFPSSARPPHEPRKTFFGADINLEKENLHEIKKVEILKLLAGTAVTTRNLQFDGGCWQRKSEICKHLTGTLTCRVFT